MNKVFTTLTVIETIQTVNTPFISPIVMLPLSLNLSTIVPSELVTYPGSTLAARSKAIIRIIRNNTKASSFRQAFSLCSGLTGSIPAELFANTPNVTDFDRTFYECSSLTSVMIPESVIEIDDNAFSNYYTNLTIHCTAGSYAENYAKENGIAYVTE